MDMTPEIDMKLKTVSLVVKHLGFRELVEEYCVAGVSPLSFS